MICGIEIDIGEGGRRGGRGRRRGREEGREEGERGRRDRGRKTERVNMNKHKAC